MKHFYKFLIVLSLLIAPVFVEANFDKNLYYGLQNDNSVIELQEFLVDQGVYSGPITGNYFSLTLKAVKEFQSANLISPASGYFGPLTRQKANELLLISIGSAEDEAKVDNNATPASSSTTNDVVKSLQDQINLLMQQLIAMQNQEKSAQQTNTQLFQLQSVVQQQANTIQQQQNTLNQIAQNTCTPNWTCGEWTTCSNSSQTRTCSDTNNCGKSDGKPSENQSCYSPLEASCSSQIVNNKVIFTAILKNGYSNGNYKYWWGGDCEPGGGIQIFTNSDNNDKGTWIMNTGCFKSWGSDPDGNTFSVWLSNDGTYSSRILYILDMSTDEKHMDRIWIRCY